MATKKGKSMKMGSLSNLGDKGKSSPMSVAVGSGSRPGKSKIAIPRTNPKNEHTMERAPSKWLK
jgi:hypothetical protein